MQEWGGGVHEGRRGGGQSYTRLLFSFTCSPLQSLQTLPHLFLIPSGFVEIVGVDFFSLLLVLDKVEKTLAACILANL